MKPILFVSICLLVALTVRTQVSLQNPTICHDKKGFLRSYKDDNCQMFFGNGNFQGFVTTDSLVRYTEADRKMIVMTSLQKGDFRDSLVIQLLRKSVLLKYRDSVVEITSLEQLRSLPDSGYLTARISGGFVQGFIFLDNKRKIFFDLMVRSRQWSWDIVIRQADRNTAFAYNLYTKNRLQYIFIQDSYLRCGISIGHTFKNYRKITDLKTGFVTEIERNGRPVVTSVQPENPYAFYYNKKGKLVKQETGQLIPCVYDRTD